MPEDRWSRGNPSRPDHSFPHFARGVEARSDCGAVSRLIFEFGAHGDTSLVLRVIGRTTGEPVVVMPRRSSCAPLIGDLSRSRHGVSPDRGRRVPDAPRRLHTGRSAPLPAAGWTHTGRPGAVVLDGRREPVERVVPLGLPRPGVRPGAPGSTHLLRPDAPAMASGPVAARSTAEPLGAVRLSRSVQTASLVVPSCLRGGRRRLSRSPASGPSRSRPLRSGPARRPPRPASPPAQPAPPWRSGPDGRRPPGTASARPGPPRR